MMSTSATRFVILCQPRTGSSRLHTSLRQHPQLFLHGEILNHRQPRDLPDAGDRRLQAALSRTTHPAVGCSLHAFQPDRRWSGWSKWEPAWRALANDPAIKVIHLRRLDTLAQLASWKIAALLGRWGHQHDIVPRPTIRIDREGYRWFGDWNEAVYAWRLSHLPDHQFLPVTYEALCTSWNDTLHQIQQFVGIEPQPLPQAVRKNETRPLNAVIENYAELRAQEEGTGQP